MNKNRNIKEIKTPIKENQQAEFFQKEITKNIEILSNSNNNSFKDDFTKVSKNLADIAKNLALSPILYKIVLTDVLAAYNQKTQENNLLEIQNNKLTRDQIFDRAFGKDFKSYKDRCVMDLLVMLGASPKLPIVVIPGPGLVGSALSLSVQSANYNAVRKLDKFPDTINLLPKFYDELVISGENEYRTNKKFKDIMYLSKEIDNFPKKFNVDLSPKEIAKNLHGVDLYNFLSTYSIKKHFVDKFKNINELFSKENKPDQQQKNLFSPLHCIALDNLNELNYNLLIAKGADINIKNSNGDTPSHYAGNSGNLNFIKFSISKNADLNHKNKDGMTPLDLAKKQYNFHVENGIYNSYTKQYKDIITLIGMNKLLSNKLEQKNTIKDKTTMAV
jgi:hypothetical protein